MNTLFSSIRSLIFILLACNTALLYAQQSDKEAEEDGFGGPDQVGNQIKSDMEAARLFFELGFISPYFDFKDRLKENTGLGYGIDYSSSYLKANESPGHSDAGSGMVRLYASWDLVNRKPDNKGTLIFKVEHRHKYGAIPPQSLGFEMGYVGLEIPPFSDQGFRLTNFYWRQRFLGGKISMIAGLLDATDYVDVYALASPWTGFMNFAFSTGSQAIYIPNDAALGFGLAGYITKNIFMIGSISDAGADPTKPWNSFESFFTNNDYFKSVELGYVSEASRFILDNIHVTYWHSDGSDVTASLAGWGLAFSGTWYFGNKWLPFLRGGYAKDGGTLLQKSISAGVGFQPVPKGSVLGFGFNWGEINETTFASGMRDQYTFELYYRAQISSKIAVTPDIQYLINPAMNTDVSSIFLWGVRGRISL